MRHVLAISLCLLLAVGSVHAQAPRSFIELDSLLFARPDTTPPYPFRAQYDSIQAQRRQVQQEAEGTIDFFPADPAPVVRSDTGRVAYEEFLLAKQLVLSDSLFCLVQLKVAWTGTVEQARLTACKGGKLPSSIDLRSIFKRVVFERMNGDSEFPMPGMVTSLPVYGSDSE